MGFSLSSGSNILSLFPGGNDNSNNNDNNKKKKTKTTWLRPCVLQATVQAKEFCFITQYSVVPACLEKRFVGDMVSLWLCA